MTSLTPNIELILPDVAINSLALSFYHNGQDPVEAALLVSSRPFMFDGSSLADKFIVRNIETGEVTFNYTGITADVKVVNNEVLFIMDNGDVLNISLAMRSIGKGVFARMMTLISLVGNPN